MSKSVRPTERAQGRLLPVTPGQKASPRARPAVAPGSLRSERHESVFRAIEHAAWERFAEVGFERATVGEISAAAGVSRRTFFRYFRSKEELLSFSVEGLGKRVAERFAAAPLKKEPFRALEDSILTITEESHDTRRPKEMLGLMLEEPALRGRFLCALDRWVPALSEELMRRKAYRGDAGRCDLAASFYCTAFDQAHVRWYRERNQDLIAHLKRAFRQLRDCTPPR